MPRRSGSPRSPLSSVAAVAGGVEAAAAGHVGGRSGGGAIRYILADRVATGGMAAVHLAQAVDHAGRASVVAVKRLHAHHAEDARFVAMFLEEARMASLIHHANVVAPHDIVPSGSELFLVMDYVHGASLSTLVGLLPEGSRAPLPIAVAIVIDALHGLAAAHEARGTDGSPLHLVHRDVSPQNLMVGADGITRVIDFGIAKARGREVESSTGSVKGKFAYMAPEQLRGRAVSPLADVYAVGVLLWELLAGRRLFQGSDGEVVEQVLLGEAPSPGEVMPDVPYELGVLVSSALAYEPDARPPTAELFARSLLALVTPASASEVAAWVEGLAGAQLAQRRARVEALARGDAVAAPGSVVLAAHEGSTVASRSTRSVVRRKRRVAAALALTVALVAAVAGARTLGGTRARAAALPAANEPSAAETAPALPAATTLVDRSSASLAPDLRTAEVGAGSAAAQGSRAEASPPALELRDAGAHPRRPAPVTRPKKSVHREDCAMPYVIDDLGRKIYKRECLR